MKITKPSLSLILGSLTLTVFCFALLGLINLI
jgi:hypothetical protein